MASDQSGQAIAVGTYLGFDFGIRKIGVAVGNLETGTASPLVTILAVEQKPDWLKISELIDSWQPTGLVVGVSKREDGSDNLVTPRIMRFSRQLEGRYALPVHQVDERLSTFEAKQLLFDETGVNATTLWKVQDQVAASLILQTWFGEVREDCC